MVRTIYGFYEEPLLFSCESLTGALFLVLRLQGEDGVWLMSGISEKRLIALEKNELEIRALYLNPESGFLYLVRNNEGRSVVDILEPGQLTEDMLPYSGEYADYQIDEDSSRREYDIAEVADDDNCAVIEIAFEKDDSHAHEISCAALGDALCNMQLLVYSLAYKEEKTYGQFPKAIREQHELKVVETFAASFGVRLQSGSFENDEQKTATTDVLERLDLLLNASESSDNLRFLLNEESNRTAVYYNNLLKGLKRNNLGFRFRSAMPMKSFGKHHLTIRNVTDTIQRISNDIQEINKVEEYDGELKGIDIEKNQFTFISETDGENIRITGKISEKILERSFLVPSRATVKVKTTTSFDKVTGEERYSFLLMEVKNRQE